MKAIRNTLIFLYGSAVANCWWLWSILDNSAKHTGGIPLIMFPTMSVVIVAAIWLAGSLMDKVGPVIIGIKRAFTFLYGALVTTSWWVFFLFVDFDLRCNGLTAMIPILPTLSVILVSLFWITDHWNDDKNISK